MKFTAKGGVTLTLRSSNPGTVTVEIRDTGSGDVMAVSNEGSGSSFTLTLPRTTAAL